MTWISTPPYTRAIDEHDRRYPTPMLIPPAGSGSPQPLQHGVGVQIATSAATTRSTQPIAGPSSAAARASRVLRTATGKMPTTTQAGTRARRECFKDRLTALHRKARRSRRIGGVRFSGYQLLLMGALLAILVTVLLAVMPAAVGAPAADETIRPAGIDRMDAPAQAPGRPY